MRKVLKSMALMLAAALLLSVLAGCGSSTSVNTPTSSTQAASTQVSTTAKKVPDFVELKFLLPGDPVNRMQEILDEFYNRTKDTLNTKISIEFIPWADLGTKITLKLSAGEQLDATFGPMWAGFSDWVAKGDFQKLDKYFYNDQYPALKKHIPSILLENNKLIGSDKQAGIYAIPFVQAYNMANGFYVRQDLREKYGLPLIKTRQDIEAFFDAVLKNEKGMVPLGINGATNGVSAYTNWDMFPELLDPNSPYTSTDSPASNSVQGIGLYTKHAKFTPGNSIVAIQYAADDQDGKKYQAAVDSISPPSAKGLDPLRYYKTAREWVKKGYVEKDVINQSNAQSLFEAGKFASCYGDSNTFFSEAQKIEKAIPGAKMEFVYPGGIEYFGKVKTSLSGVWNFQAIPTSSPNADRVMAFYEWYFEDEKNYDLFVYGIEGKDYIPVGDKNFKVPEGADPAKRYVIIPEIMGACPDYARIPAEYPEDLQKIFTYCSDINNYYIHALSGFVFDPTPVQDEVTKMSQLGDLLAPLSNGMVDDIDGTYKKVIDKWYKAGQPKISAEVYKQVSAYLANLK